MAMTNTRMKNHVGNVGASLKTFSRYIIDVFGPQLKLSCVGHINHHQFYIRYDLETIQYFLYS